MYRTQAISEFCSFWCFDLVLDTVMFVFLLAYKYGLWIICLCLHSMGYLSSNTTTSLFSFFFHKGDFLAISFSLFGGGPPGLLDLALPSRLCV